MPAKLKFRDWIVFIVSVGAYTPLLVGGWKHPSEINSAALGLWLILSAMLAYSSLKQGFAGWRMALGFFFGNGLMLILGFIRGGYTFNLGRAETSVFYGIVATVSVWVAVGQVSGKWNPRILYLGGIGADTLSFYPLLKQYLLPHEAPTVWMCGGWAMFAIGTWTNVFLVEKLGAKLRMSKELYLLTYKQEKNKFLIFEESLFSIENGTFIIVTMFVMMR